MNLVSKKAGRKSGSNPARKRLPVVSEVSPEQQLEIRATPDEEMNLYPLDTFAYEYPGKRIEISFTMPEFTAICPFSDFPDFATINLMYVPNRRCIELKSLKLYINSFRDVKIFHEHVVNKILEDFVAACDPLEVRIEGDFNVRGNIRTVIRASYLKQTGRQGERGKRRKGT
jgi:7-cyano-7-deazaguanine reductase